MPVRLRHARRPAGALLAAAVLAPAPGPAAEPARPTGGDLGEIVVTAGLRDATARSLPASVAVLDADALSAVAGSQHFEDVAALVPNLNWSGGSARPRYLQLRGIGELEQYQGAPNPSVGFLVDDVDFSGLGMVATLYDLERIEVLRGPQGTRYGANALGGLVYARSAAPSTTPAAGVDAGIGDFGRRSVGGYVTGPVAALDSAFRLAVQSYRSDGFLDNAFLGRPTNERDELTARARWLFAPGEALEVDVSLLHARLDDGYDAFAIDNSRTTLSDRPGEDSQRATGASVRATWDGFAPARLTLIAARADSRSVHAYDGDWGNATSWAPYTYDFAYRADRDRTTDTLEARLASRDGAGPAWLAGVWAQELDEAIDERSGGTYADPVADFGFATDDALASRYRARSLAAFGQLDGALAPRLAWSAGLRLERRTARYADATTSAGAPTGGSEFRPSDGMVGGHASLSWELAADRRAYLALSRGYRAGGFNPSAVLPPERREFGPEAVWNLEAGWRATLAGGRLRAEATLFRMRREDLQIRTGVQLVPGDPNTFVFYTGNAARGRNQGLEASLRWRATPALEVGASLGLLDARYEGFAIAGEPVPDRAQPHAPDWQAAVDATWRDPRGWFVRLDATGSDGFWFDVPPNPARADAYALVHARVGWEGARWSASLWGRNLGDERHAVRGFWFGNEPPDFPEKLYVQLGAPRQLGVDVSFRY